MTSKRLQKTLYKGELGNAGPTSSSWCYTELSRELSPAAPLRQRNQDRNLWSEGCGKARQSFKGAGNGLYKSPRSLFSPKCFIASPIPRGSISVFRLPEQLPGHSLSPRGDLRCALLNGGGGGDVGCLGRVRVADTSHSAFFCLLRAAVMLVSILYPSVFTQVLIPLNGLLFFSLLTSSYYLQFLL